MGGGVGRFDACQPMVGKKVWRCLRLSSASLWTMVVVCGIVWGGFVSLLTYALSREARRRGRRDSD